MKMDTKPLPNDLTPGSPAFEDALRAAETEDNPAAFKALYQRVATPARWNADVMMLIAAEPDSPRRAQRIRIRYGDWAIPTGETLIALYRRDPQSFRQVFDYDSRLHSSTSHFKLPADARLDQFRAFLRDHDPQYWARLMERFGTQADFQRAVEWLITTRPKNAGELLDLMYHYDGRFAMDAAAAARLIELYGESIRGAVERFNHALFIRRVETILAETADPIEAITHLSNISRRGWNPLERAAHLWAIPLYERDPVNTAHFLIQHVPADSPTYHDLLARAAHDGYDDLYRGLFGKGVTEARWDAAIRAGMAAEATSAGLWRALNRHDVRADRYWGDLPFIADDLAAQLVRRLGVEVEDYLTRYVRPDHDYPLLYAALKEGGDMNFFARIFRKTATFSAWERAMSDLLAADIPSDRIVDELERLKPATLHEANPAILARFLDKYGAAVIPFFERHLDWTHPDRLRALLALDIERGALLRELQAIAARQPREFGARADVWALPLYERGVGFFGRFIARYLSAQDNAVVGKQILRRMEADGHEALFRQLHERLYVGKAWNDELADLIRTTREDGTLLTALNRRAGRWQTIDDEVAAPLYERNPDLFQRFILDHVRSSNWDRREYKRLLRAADSRGDTAMVDAIRRRTDPKKQWEHDLNIVWVENVPPEQIAERLRAILPQNTWDLPLAPLVRFAERYGDAIIPFLRTNARWSNDGGLIRALEKNASRAALWAWRFSGSYQIVNGWFEALEHAVTYPDDADFARELAILTPSGDTPRWIIRQATALALYQRSPSLARAFLMRFYRTYDETLLMRAESNADLELVDFQLSRAVLQSNQWARQAHPQQGAWVGQRADKKAGEQLAAISAAVHARFDAWYAADPTLYVRRAAHILSFIQPFDLGWSAPSENNPIWMVLTTRNADAWRASPAAITELLESLNIFIQIAAFDLLLAGGDPDPALARCVIANLRSFRACLFSNVRRNMKHKALACLTAAAAVDDAARAAIVPILAHAAEYQARRSVGDAAAVALVQLEG
jgi:hypothetical protein